MKKILIIVIAVLSVFTGSLAFAQGLGGVKQTSCPVTERFKNWDIFLTSLLTHEGFIEYWADILSRNYCHQLDIDLLITRIDKTLGNIRSAFYACNNEKVDTLESLYHTLELELAYVRSVVQTDPESFAWWPGRETVVIDKTALRNKLHAAYVQRKGWFTAKGFETLFEKLEKKYASRIPEYQQCTDVTFQQLSDRFQEFVETAAGVIPAAEKFATGVEKKWKKITQSPPGRSGQFLNGILGVRINEIPAEQSLAQLAKDLAKLAPGGRPTYQDLLGALAEEQNRYFEDLSLADLQARYETLYKNAGDETVAELTGKTEEMNIIINDTVPVINQISTCAAYANSQQCVK